ncbi:TIGR01244 family protein [Rhizobium sp. RU35A]|nr:TIGR01244 family protein [Rhizobium sp. RU35A]
MMDIREINDEYAVTGQITPEDLDQIKAMGFKSIVCHRPDDEEPGQPNFDVVAARARELGLEIAHVPVGRMGVDADAVRGMVDALDEFPRPMLGYCRSGARSTAIYEKSQHLRG